MGNKVKFGLKNVHYAVITVTDGVVSYGTPVKIPGAVNLVTNAVGDKTEFFADDMAYFVQNANGGYEGTLEMALIPDSFRKDVLGDKIDKNGVLFENANAIAKDFALLYEFSGDANSTRRIFYNVNAARPNEEGSTKTKTLEPKTEVLNITASPAIDTGDVKAKAEPTQTVAYDGWYSEVYLYEAPVEE